MEFKHRSVLLEECIEGLNIKPDGIYVDGTMGGAGHSEKICERLSEKGTFIGIDRDLEAIEVSKERLKSFPCKKYFVHSNYCEIVSILEELKIDGIDGALLDIGVSSYQLDNETRGFSYMKDAPLDMRMDRSKGFSAFDLINEYDEEEIYRIIREYGEERWAKRIANFICEERKNKPIETTFELVEIIKKAVPKGARTGGPHPAKRTFQAIRIEVNEELDKLALAIEDFIKVLNIGGRLEVITFHSLEDRIVKDVINEKLGKCTCPPEFPVCICNHRKILKKITKKPILPSKVEIEENPRSRSSKLRICEKIEKI